MLAAVPPALAAPWLTPVALALRAPGWHVGRSGTRREAGLPHMYSVAWAATVRCRECATSNPPNDTLRALPQRGIIVRVSIQPPDPTGWPPRGRELSRGYSLAHAYRFRCCEAVTIGGDWELYGFGPERAYSVIVDAYWGSAPTRAMQAAAQRAISTMRLPAAR
jgi:hypothetical protein